MRWSRSLLPLACSFALAVGCSSGPPLLRGAINADGSVNPDRGGRASPIVVRVYELKSVAAFRDLEQSRWRQAVPVPAKGSATLTLGIQARAISLAVK